MGDKPWVGVSVAHRRLVERIETIAVTDGEVLITGPSGVGKEYYARHVHDSSRRAGRPFVAVNCGSIPEELFENELFGHVSGAFTGARPRSDGLAAAAEGGTLFLDEIDTLSSRNQVKLLRFVQEKQYRRLGESRSVRADLRIVAATNANLIDAMRQGRFREDLLFRIRVIPLEVLPLCDRPDDIDAILNAYADWYAALYELPRIQLSPSALEAIHHYHWPGNVRELENCVHYLTCLRLTRPVDPSDLALLEQTRPSARGVLPSNFHRAKTAVVNDFEQAVVREALDASDGNIAQAARMVGKPRRAFFELMRRHKIPARDLEGATRRRGSPTG